MTTTSRHRVRVLIAVGVLVAIGARASLGAPPPKPAPRETLIAWSAPLQEDLDRSLVGASAGVWTPDGKQVLTAGWARSAPDATPVGEVRAWDASTGKVVRTYRGTAGSYRSLS